MGIWHELLRLIIQYCKRQRRKSRQRQTLLLDGSIVKAPSGGDLTGPSPVHRARLGSKRSVLTNSEGLPVAVVVGPANRHDSKLVEATLQASMTPLRRTVVIADKGYVGKAASASTASRGAHLMVPTKSAESPRREVLLLRGRWRVERTFAWLNQFRALATRYDRKSVNYLGMLYLAVVLCWIRYYRLK